MKNILSIIVIAVVFTSCEKVVDVDYKDSQSRIIIEGTITNEAGPYFVKDFVSIAMQCVDESIAAYYTTLAQMADSGPGGGTTPNNPPNNISNGALGVFSAHTTETQNVTIR